MTRYGLYARFNLRLTIHARNPDDAWRRANGAARLIERHANRVHITALEYSGKNLKPEQRAAMSAAAKSIPEPDFLERATYYKIHRAMGVLTERRVHLTRKLDRLDYALPDHVFEREEREAAALDVALGVLEGTLRTHEPIHISGLPRQADGIERDDDQGQGTPQEPIDPMGGRCPVEPGSRHTPRLVGGDGSEC